MKELSIEEKARRYDEAIEKAKSKIRDDKDHVLYEDDVIEIFPEIKIEDSEDEKIRKELIAAFQNGVTYNQISKARAKDYIAWLEKKDEQMPAVIIPKFRVGDTIRIKNSDAEYTITEISDGYYRGKCWCLDIAAGDECGDYELVEQKPCMIQWKGDNLKEVIGFTGKDKNFDKWFTSFEEYEKYIDVHNGIFKLFNEDGSHYEVPIGSWIVRTPDGYNIASKAVFKPAPTELSKEDERIKNNLLSELTNLSVRKLIEKETEKKYASWLKSLRPQSTWKPSEEQLIQLSNASNGLYYNCETLLSLLEQLKKLK